MTCDDMSIMTAYTRDLEQRADNPTKFTSLRRGSRRVMTGGQRSTQHEVPPHGTCCYMYDTWSHVRHSRQLGFGIKKDRSA